MWPWPLAMNIVLHTMLQGIEPILGFTTMGFRILLTCPWVLLHYCYSFKTVSLCGLTIAHFFETGPREEFRRVKPHHILLADQRRYL